MDFVVVFDMHDILRLLPCNTPFIQIGFVQVIEPNRQAILGGIFGVSANLSVAHHVGGVIKKTGAGARISHTRHIGCIPPDTRGVQREKCHKIERTYCVSLFCGDSLSPRGVKPATKKQRRAVFLADVHFLNFDQTAHNDRDDRGCEREQSAHFGGILNVVRSNFEGDRSHK